MIKNRDDFFKYLTENYQYKKNRMNKCPDRYCRTNNLRPNLMEAYKEANFLLKICHKLGFHKAIRTPCGAFKRHRLNTIHGAYDMEVVKNSQNDVIKGYILTILLYDYYFKFSFGALKTKTENGGYGSWMSFVKACKECGINIEDYAISTEEGKEIKKEIESPLINVYNNTEVIEHVHHIDLHAAYPSIIIEHYPEFEPVFAKLKKPIGDIAIGYMQSKYINYKYAHLAKLAVNNVVAKIIHMSKVLELLGYKIVCHNTDGIWYYDKTGQNRMYHDKDEGPGFSHWEHDYIDVTFEGNSSGVYCFWTKDGKFNVRLRGFTKKDAEKPREEWTYDDYFEAIYSINNLWYDENKEQFICEK